MNKKPGEADSAINATTISEDNAWEQAPIMILKPAVRSAWFLFFGLFLGPAIIYFGRDPDGHPAKWVALSLLSLGLILHRLGLSYVLEGGKLRARPWWGLGSEETVTLAAVTAVRPMEGLVGRLVGCAHLDVRSGAYNEPGFIILGQADSGSLARRLERLAAEACRAAHGVSAELSGSLDPPVNRDNLTPPEGPGGACGSG